ncbi:MAG: uracil-DNA glycosylase family protein [Nitrospirota bacterium]|nr:uracil-DNA glycosylase family protein [Nitrospirota bacterium]
MKRFELLITEVRDCTICASHLPHSPRPVLQLHPQVRLLIAGQAPGWKVHESGKPFDDASGERLCAWMGVMRNDFYNTELVAILPMGFCFPGNGIWAIKWTCSKRATKKRRLYPTFILPLQKGGRPSTPLGKTIDARKELS